MEFGRTQRRLQKYSRACSLDYEELGSLSHPEPWDCAHSVLILGYPVGHGPHPTVVVTTHTGVGLVRTEGNYLSSTQVGLLNSYLARISM
jgi:hypothetical protein